jgi:hypothetical protein
VIGYKGFSFRKLSEVTSKMVYTDRIMVKDTAYLVIFETLEKRLNDLFSGESDKV